MTIIKKIIAKKELGQFFSGPAVASLLTKLAKCHSRMTVIDPMCGTGDLLEATRAHNPEAVLTGIEIDNDVFEIASRRLKKHPNIHLIASNAFDLKTLENLDREGYDLVITNPPYVRHQTMNGSLDDFETRLNLNEIRNNLSQYLSETTHLSNEEKCLFSNFIQNYSGLSDLAVPSWILCTLLVKKHGKIAVVLPEAWLSRDYALIIKYLLLRLFKLEYIIEDANSKWFYPAQVKTILLVAKRIPAKETISDWNQQAFTYVQLYQKASTRDSLIGTFFPRVEDAEQNFVKAIDKGLSVPGLFQTRHICLKEFADSLTSQAANMNWYKQLEKAKDESKSKTKIKFESALGLWLTDAKVSFGHLNEFGISIGQGLRTGANDFFYLDFETVNEDEIKVFPSEQFRLSPFIISKKYFRQVVRKQSELDDVYSLHNFKSKGVVLSLQSYALPEDIRIITSYNKSFESVYKPLPDSLVTYIQNASVTNNRKKSSDKLISELSAVRSNQKVWNPQRPNEPPRFWYMLPAFTRRHFPDLFIPRINNKEVRAQLNPGGKFLVDANFSSLWMKDFSSAYDNYSLLALLNSIYASVAMEEYGTVLGGGALKLEATQLRKIPFPVLNQEAMAKLSFWGKEISLKRIAPHTSVIEIDQIILQGMGYSSNTTEKINELTSLQKQLLLKRRKK